MNIENIFFKQPTKPLTPDRRKVIKICRIGMFVAVAFMVPSFINAVMGIQSGAPEMHSHEHLTGILLPIAMIFQASFFWFMVAARLHPEKARRNLVISSISMVIFFVLASVSLWFTFHR